MISNLVSDDIILIILVSIMRYPLYIFYSHFNMINQIIMIIWFLHPIVIIHFLIIWFLITDISGFWRLSGRASSWRRSDSRPFAKSDPFGRTSPRTAAWCGTQGKEDKILVFHGEIHGFLSFSLTKSMFHGENPVFCNPKDLKSTFLLAKSIFYWWKPWRVLTTLHRLLAISLGLTARSLFVIVQQLNTSSTRSMKTQFMLDNINFFWL